MCETRIIFIGGPTASGKSAMGMEIAHRMQGEIVNADAIQVYKDLQILSARPTPEEMGAIEHHLFGYLNGQERCSAGRWVRAAAPVVQEILARERTAIIVGGTGLYFRALEEGLSPIPDVADGIRLEAQDHLSKIGREAFYQEVIGQDPVMERLDLADTQRLIRAWSVYQATGKPLSFFQSLPREPLLPVPVSARIVVMPDRQVLYARCEERFDHMLAAGALREAEQLQALGLSDDLPVMKALGAAELISHLRGNMSLVEAIDLAKRNTRRFAKRQMTWFRRQARDWTVASETQVGSQKFLEMVGLNEP